MKLTDYIHGRADVREAHDLERAAMEDPLLADALEGYGAFPGGHGEALQRMQALVAQRTRRTPRRLFVRARTWGVAASLLLCMAAGGYLMTLARRQHLLSMAGRTEGGQLLAQGYAEKLPIETLVDFSEFERDLSEAPSIDFEPPVFWDMIAAVIPEPEEDRAVMAAGLVAVPQAAVMETADSADRRDGAAVTGVASARDYSGAKASAYSAKGDAAPQAVPQDGYVKYTRYLKRNMRRPSDECARVKGVVRLIFDVDSTGRPVSVRVTEPLCPSCDREAIRLVSEGPEWKPACSAGMIYVEF